MNLPIKKAGLVPGSSPPPLSTTKHFQATSIEAPSSSSWHTKSSSMKSPTLTTPLFSSGGMHFNSSQLFSSSTITSDPPSWKPSKRTTTNKTPTPEPSPSIVPSISISSIPLATSSPSISPQPTISFTTTKGGGNGGNGSNGSNGSSSSYDPSPTGSYPAGPNGNGHDSGGDSTGWDEKIKTVIGPVAGGIALIIVIAVIVIMSLKRRRKNRDRGGHFNYLDEEVTARFSDKMLQARALHAQSHTREILDDDHDNDPSNDGNPTAGSSGVGSTETLHEEKDGSIPTRGRSASRGASFHSQNSLLLDGLHYDERPLLTQSPSKHQRRQSPQGYSVAQSFIHHLSRRSTHQPISFIGSDDSQSLQQIIIDDGLSDTSISPRSSFRHSSMPFLIDTLFGGGMTEKREGQGQGLTRCRSSGSMGSTGSSLSERRRLSCRSIPPNMVFEKHALTEPDGHTSPRSPQLFPEDQEKEEQRKADLAEILP